MVVPSNVVFVWVGTNAGVPAGWSRDTAFDGKYVLGASVGGGGGATGGNATHAHTVVDHTHTSAATHLHTIVLNAASTFRLPAAGVGKPATTTHAHASFNSANNNTTLESTSVTLQGANNAPPYYEVIFIKSGGTDDVPNNAVAFLDNSTVPAGWTAYASGTNVFWKGAGTGAGAGGTGGSATHSHSESALTPHIHNQATHTHASVNSGATKTVGAAGGSTTLTIALGTHVHATSLNGGGSGDVGGINVTTQNANGQPPYKNLYAIQNTSGGELLTSTIIGLWTSTVGSIPTNWARVSGMDDYFLHNATNSGDIGGTGGANQHTHTADTHGHTGLSHNHTATIGSGSTIGFDDGIFTAVSDRDHTHTATVGNATPTYNNTIVTVNNNTSKDNYPPYVEVLFIKYTAPVISYNGQVMVFV